MITDSHLKENKKKKDTTTHISGQGFVPEYIKTSKKNKNKNKNSKIGNSTEH